MSIVATEVDVLSDGGVSKRKVYMFRCQDHLGAWHPWGPLFVHEDGFDLDAFKPKVAAKVEARLADDEARAALE